MNISINVHAGLALGAFLIGTRVWLIAIDAVSGVHV